MRKLRFMTGLCPLDIVVAGRDTVTVDVVCPKVLGYVDDEVPYFQKAA